MTLNKKQSFEERLTREVLRGDGSMGYLLTLQGVPRNQSFEFLNIERPDTVSKVHRAYIDQADVDLIQTNTFGANRFHLQSFGRGHEKFVDVINREGVEIARAACAGRGTLIGGSIGPITHSAGDSLARSSDDATAIREAYEEQVQALGHAGIDVFMIETVHRYGEGIAALEAARSLFPELPVVFQIATTRRGQTLAGDDLETLIRAATERGASCVGLNCFLDPAQMYEQILELQEWTDLPISAQPNVGKRGLLCQGVFETDRSLQTTVRSFALKLVEAGARLIGGCCGITPNHISLVRENLEHVTTEKLEALTVTRAARYQRAQRLQTRVYATPKPPEGSLEQHLRQTRERGPVLVELDPPRLGEPLEPALAGAQQLVEAGVRYLTIGDNPGRVPRLDRNLFAQLVKQRAPSAELVIHLSCADLTLVRFTTELESLRHLSRNILVISGDPPSGDYARSSAPYDLRAIGAIRAFSRRNHGISTNWQEGLETTDYFLGGALNPRALEAQMRRLWTKTAEAGASFCLTQPVFDTETLERLYHATEALRARLKAERGRDCFVMPGVMALTSLRNAQLLRREFGMPISKPLLAELAGLEGRKARRARGRELRREMMRLCRTDLPFPGLYVVPQFHDYADCIEDLRETGWLESKEEAR